MVKIELMDSFFVENGRKNLIFCYSEPDSPNDGNRSSQQQQQQAANKQGALKINRAKVQIVDSSDLILKGVCIFFVRNTTSTAITTQNISQVSVTRGNWCFSGGYE